MSKIWFFSTQKCVQNDLNTNFEVLIYTKPLVFNRAIEILSDVSGTHAKLIDKPMKQLKNKAF